MQAQTTRTFNGNLQKIAGGLLIGAALVAGAIGLTNVSGLEIPGTGSNSAVVTAPVADRHFAPYFGEGLPLTNAAAAATADRVTTSRQMEAPQGEGLPMIDIEQSQTRFNPQGEGLPLGSQ